MTTLAVLASSVQLSDQALGVSVTSSCPFCAIVAGEAGASIVHADATCLAFLTKRQVRPYETLVIPQHEHTDIVSGRHASIEDGHVVFRCDRIPEAPRSDLDSRVIEI